MAPARAELLLPRRWLPRQICHLECGAFDTRLASGEDAGGALEECEAEWHAHFEDAEADTSGFFEVDRYSGYGGTAVEYISRGILEFVCAKKHYCDKEVNAFCRSILSRSKM